MRDRICVPRDLPLPAARAAPGPPELGHKWSHYAWLHEQQVYGRALLLKVLLVL